MTDLLLDVMCGTLATYLRMCGYDAAYALDRDIAPDAPDEALLVLARREGRRIVTRDRDLASRSPDAILLDGRAIETQLSELSDAGFELAVDDEPAYCGDCNGRLDAVDADRSTPDYAPKPDETDVWRCRACGQHFWRGSHWDDVAETIAEIED
ncbi:MULTISPECIES: Mut7-C RNAse domain-containing protein [Halomicrobium]|uniref:Mut7-C RNAse domain-containing protein n=2 Tax=Halomicrobium mukohataei TaxID=57705 RepID=C7P1K2_HALMD|nr:MULTISPECIES: Mut7-C RNAse domain-containing protein [Halomicrobium]ACV49092.1 protein of unknown function DUF82 [Halomicrobium mukohataei DSM 12286]QCD64508.1 hypothetical protein E5139_02210 [Halomicrobium mukohataei]QFR19314.1 hypothetical protein GBQ70_02210 [Halomicrobium sp. ZPS1]